MDKNTNNDDLLFPFFAPLLILVHYKFNNTVMLEVTGDRHLVLSDSSYILRVKLLLISHKSIPLTSEPCYFHPKFLNYSTKFLSLTKLRFQYDTFDIITDALL